MRLRIQRRRPEPWSVRRQSIKHSWAVPLWAFEWFWEWVAFVLGNWSLLEVLEYLGSFSVVIAVIFYFSESGDRLKQKHYQAWQVINTAQGKGGSGGRIEALQELNADGVPLVGVEAAQAFLQGIHLSRARLVRCNLSAADLRDSDFSFADFSDATLQSANFRHSNLRNANFEGAALNDADLMGADLANANLSGTNLENTDLRNTDLQNIRWNGIASTKNANVFGVKNAPQGFVSWAVHHGAVQIESDDSWPPGI